MGETVEVGILFQHGRDGIWLGFCPAVRGASAQGATVDECRRRLQDAVTSALMYAPSDDLDDIRESQPRDAAAEVLRVEVSERDDADDLVTQAEISRLAGVTRQAVHRWARERKDFPRPATRRPAGPLWHRDDVLRWLAAAAREPGRPSSAASPWRHEEHRDVAFLCSFHLRGAIDPAALTRAVVDQLEKLGADPDIEPGEIRALGSTPISR